MADVTDAAFRRIIAKYGKPDVFWTEFVSADGLCSPGREVLLNDLKYSEEERPIVAQLFTGRPERMREAATLIQNLGFDGIDINMGCPDRGVEKQGAGASLIKDLKKAKEIIQAAREGAQNIPISVKTRIGYNKEQLQEWVGGLLEEDLAAVSIHARTRKEMSSVPAQWEKVKEAVSLRDQMKKKTLIIGNGDVVDLDDAKKRVEETGADGAMLGRAIFGNPWLFGKRVPEVEEKLHVMVEHTKLFEEILGKVKSFSIMKKHYKAYVSGFDGAKELRMRLMEKVNANEVEMEVEDFLRRLKS